MPRSTSKKTTLYALGSNGSGQLGLSHKDDTAHPEKCRFKSSGPDGKTTYTDYVPLQEGEEVTKLVGGGNHTLLLTTHGRVFGAGSWSATQAGRREDADDLGFCEVDTTQFANAGREVLDKGDFLRKPTLHTVEQPNNNSHELSNSDFKVTDIAATWEASFFVVDEQQIYCCGAGDKGELGRGDVREFLHTEPPFWLIFDLRQVKGYDTNLKIQRISACMNHVVLRTSNGTLYGWGNSRKGQLGSSLQREKVIWEPMQLHADGVSSQIRHVVTGRDFTFVMGEFGNDYALLGAAPKGGFDFPIDFRDIIPDFTDDEELMRQSSDLLEFHALWGSIMVRVPNGYVQGFGRNDHGQLGEELQPNAIRRLAAGSEHCVALFDSGIVYAWGWGEHGNCGVDGLVDYRDQDEDQPRTPVFSPQQGQTVMGVGAGCATSFFWVEE